VSNLANGILVNVVPPSRSNLPVVPGDHEAGLVIAGGPVVSNQVLPTENNFAALSHHQMMHITCIILLNMSSSSKKVILERLEEFLLPSMYHK